MTPSYDDYYYIPAFSWDISKTNTKSLLKPPINDMFNFDGKKYFYSALNIR